MCLLYSQAKGGLGPNSCFFQKAQALWSFLAELGVPTFSQDWEGKGGAGGGRNGWLVTHWRGVGVGEGWHILQGRSHLGGENSPFREGGQGPTNESSRRPLVWRGALLVSTGQGCSSVRTW